MVTIEQVQEVILPFIWYHGFRNQMTFEGQIEIDVTYLENGERQAHGYY